MKMRRFLIDRILFPLGFRGRSARDAFSRVFRSNAWKGEESVSGTGSDLRATATVREEITSLIADLGIRSVLDAPCGDFHWMQHVDFGDATYIGVDIVPELVAANQDRHGSATRRFMNADIIEDRLPKADLVICRDCLVHLPFRHGLAALRNFKRSGSTYLLTTTFTVSADNRDILMGSWRPLDLLQPPFNLPKPLRLISERYEGVDGKYTDKSLALWRLDELKLS
jgi:SAM-dependent methyltransferase